MEKEKKHFIKTKCAELWIEDGIVIMRITVEKIDIDLGHELLEVTNRIEDKLKGKGVLLVDLGEVKNVTAEARRYFKDTASRSKKVAMVIRNLVQRVIASFMTGISKLKIPTKIFTNIENAKKWLKS